jgi:LCP family protein required for cell wall assembly
MIYSNFNNNRLLRDLERLDYQKYKKQRKSPLRKIGKFLIALAIFFAILFIIFFIKNAVYGRGQASWIDRIPVIGQIKHLAESSNATLDGETEGRINILLLGVGGKDHEGSELTDTIMVASFDTINKKVSLLSIPRDLSVPIQGKGWQRINHINAYAENADPGSGAKTTAEQIGKLLNAPIHYYAKIDFEGFEELINTLGGVEVNVDNTFDDYMYPILGQEDNPSYDARYEHLHFDKGWQKMDGEITLKYARSRHAYGIEGTDFARAARQQKVIQAVKDKALSAGTLLNPVKVSSIIGGIDNHLETNMKIWEIVKLWRDVQDIKEDGVITKVLSNQANGLLIDSTNAEGAYLLTPRAGNFGEIQYLFANIFKNIPADKKNLIQTENPKVEILNGTWINGLAGKISVDLENQGFNVISIANSSHRDFETSVIYDLTYGEKKESLKLLKDQTKANVSFNLPQWLKDDIVAQRQTNPNIGQADIILILGTNAGNNYAQ